MTQCALVTCGSVADEKTGWVDIRAFHVPEKQRQWLQHVAWGPYGEARLHRECWTNLVLALDNESDKSADKEDNSDDISSDNETVNRSNHSFNLSDNTCRSDNISGNISNDFSDNISDKVGISDNADKTEELCLTELEVSLIREAMKSVEFHDPDLFIEQEASHIVHMLQHSEYPIFFTGAGISTAAGIGDYRGLNGKWTERDKFGSRGRRGQKRCYRNPPAGELRPTYTHEAIVKLLELGIFKHVITQNIDDLHRLSGVPPSQLSELHGNRFVEKCERCGTRHDVTARYKELNTPSKWRPTPKRCVRCRMNHRTGRLCEHSTCGGCLMNTIINFGDLLEENVLRDAEEHAMKADMVVSLGSTLAVTPANTLVTMGRQPHKLVICNRQVTELDHRCCNGEDDLGVRTGSRVYGDCDKLMVAIMRIILGPLGLIEWEQGRKQRLKIYDRMRE